MARNDGLMLRSSKPLTEKFRALQPVSPGQLDCPGDADPQPGDDIRFARAGMQRERGRIERQAVMLIADPKRFRQLARTRSSCNRRRRRIAGMPWVGCNARISTALAEPSSSQTKLTHQWMP